MFSWKIARPFGIELNIHWTFWLLPLWVILTFKEPEFLPLWMHVLFIGPLFLCIVLHEYGHALMAKQFGIQTHSITLTPLGGIAQLERMSREPWEEFWIAVAGPAVNVVIAFVLGVGLGVYEAFNLGFLGVLWWRFLLIAFVANVVLVVFNMIPAFPMDGGRVLRALLAAALGPLRGTRVAVTIGTFFAILIGMVGWLKLDNPWMIFIGLFVIWAGNQELQALEMEERHRHGLDDAGVPAEFAASPGTAPAMKVTICRWDPRRGAWVRQTYSGPDDPTAG